MNGTHNPHVTFTQNGDVSYDMISPMPSSTRGTQDGSLTQGIGQMSITDVNLEQALERIQELHRENNDLRGYCEIIFYLWAPVFVDYQNFVGLWGLVFIGNI